MKETFSVQLKQLHFKQMITREVTRN